MIHRVFLPSPDLSAELRMKKNYHCLEERNSSFTRDTAAKLTRLAGGFQCDVSREFLDFGSFSKFKKIVLDTLDNISRGQTISYGELAREAGFPRTARAVGNALSSNPFPLIIPCHRVIRADGVVGSYQGGTAMKGYLLKAEND
ncbi:MAG: MGMT family protein [Candidatus Sabulitectum sp.]|nr:MGMT family protein [Candidatus Sabulitectum sp.]